MDCHIAEEPASTTLTVCACTRGARLSIAVNNSAAKTDFIRVIYVPLSEVGSVFGKHFSFVRRVRHTRKALHRHPPLVHDSLDLLLGLKPPQQTCLELQREHTCLLVAPR